MEVLPIDKLQHCNTLSAAAPPSSVSSRSSSSQSPKHAHAAAVDLSSKISSLSSKSIRPLQRNLTGAIALADTRRSRHLMGRTNTPQSSPNPAISALNALRAGHGVSRNAPAQPYSSLAEPGETSDGQDDGPSRSYTRPGTSSPANTSTSDRPISSAAAPKVGLMHFDANFGDTELRDQDRLRTKEISPRRDFSILNEEDTSSKMPSGKRHKCPYCATEFTRHHNLKSHLLTHSQEKPYICESCSARFRRVHDLKRHSKLHTGERPHLCPQCGRRFARGDALARHTKGPTGCAGRQSSFGGGDDDSGSIDQDETMDDVELKVNGENGRQEQDPSLSDRQHRRGSEPSRKRVHGEDMSPRQRHAPSTYPPHTRVYELADSTMPPPSETAHNPSNQIRPSMSGHASHRPSFSSGALYAHGSMTESPGPISPAAVGEQQQQKYRFGSYEKPNSGPTQQHGRIADRPPPRLPSPNGHSATVPRRSLPLYQAAPTGHSGASMTHPLQQQMVSDTVSNTLHSNGSSHSHSGGSSREMMGQDPQEVWAYIRNLEQRFSRMQDEYELRISRLQEDLIALKQRVFQR